MIREPIFDMAGWLDARLADDAPPVGCMWSLLDMIRVDVKKLSEMRTILERLRELASVSPNGQIQPEETERVAYAGWIDQMIEIVQPLGLSLTVKTLNKVKEIVLRGEQWPGELKRPMDDFHGRFRDELESRQFLR